MCDTHEKLALWYGTEDTLVPEGVVESGENLSVIAGVSPCESKHTVSERYRVQESFECIVRTTLS